MFSFSGTLRFFWNMEEGAVRYSCKQALPQSAFANFFVALGVLDPLQNLFILNVVVNIFL